MMLLFYFCHHQAEYNELITADLSSQFLSLPSVTDWAPDFPYDVTFFVQTSTFMMEECQVHFLLLL